RGTLILVNGAQYGFHPAGYLTADESGAVGVSPKVIPGSYWAVAVVGREQGRYDGVDDWKGTWGRTAYALGPLAPGLRGGKVGCRGGRLTVHPQNEGLAVLSATRIDAREVSGK